MTADEQRRKCYDDAISPSLLSLDHWDRAAARIAEARGWTCFDESEDDSPTNTKGLK